MDKDKIRGNFVRVVEELQKTGVIKNLVDFAEKTGAQQSNLSKIINGERNVSQAMLIGMFKAFPSINKDFVYEGILPVLLVPDYSDIGNNEGKPAGIPLIPIDAMAGFGEGETDVMERDCEWYNIPLFKGADFLIPVKGSSMYPKYSSGDIVACKRLPLDTFFQWNKVYVLDTEQGPLIKRIKRGQDDDHVHIVSENEQYDSFDLHRSKIRSLALVIGVIRAE